MKTRFGKGHRWVGYLISAGAIGALACLVDWAELPRAFRNADPAPLTLAIGFLLACYLIFALRWRTLLTDRDGLPLGPVFGIMMTGYMANLLFPLRPGDVLRGLLIDKRFGHGKLKALASVGLERLFDLGTLCAFAVLLLALVPDNLADQLREILTTALALVCGAVAGLSALMVMARSADRRGWTGPGLGGRMVSGLRRVRAALQGLAGDSHRLGPRLLAVSALSILGWGCFVAAMSGCVSAISPNMSYWAALALTVMTNLGSAVPAAPAGLGVYHALGVMTLVPFGIPTGDALAIAVVSHLLVVATQAGLGVAALYSSGAGAWRTLREAREETGTEDQA